MAYELRLAQDKDVAVCWAIIKAAKDFQRQQGFVQWTQDYPSEATIEDDVRAGKGYVFTVEGDIAGYMCVDFSGEPAYENIKGKWNTEEPYAVIHRMAFDASYRGRSLSGVAVALIEELCRAKHVDAIRVDTAPQNKRMQHILQKQGFTECGVIVFQGSEKLAYDKKLA